MDSMVDQMQSEYPLDRETLNRIGINLPGDCHRLLSHLIDEMYHRANTISVKQTRFAMLGDLVLGLLCWGAFWTPRRESTRN